MTPARRPADAPATAPNGLGDTTVLTHGMLLMRRTVNYLPFPV